MRVRYLKNVTSPPEQVGKKGDIRDLDRAIAARLIASGHVEDPAHPAQKPQPKIVNKLIESETETVNPNGKGDK